MAVVSFCESLRLIFRCCLYAWTDPSKTRAAIASLEESTIRTLVGCPETNRTLLFFCLLTMMGREESTLIDPFLNIEVVDDVVSIEATLTWLRLLATDDVVSTEAALTWSRLLATDDVVSTEATLTWSRLLATDDVVLTEATLIWALLLATISLNR